MRVTSALRWAAYYRGIVWAAGLVPLGTALVAMFFIGTNRIPRGAGEAIGVATTPQFAVAMLASLVVWQFVKTAAFYKTVAEATEYQMAERFDSEKVKSEVLSVLDERLSEMQSELERTRKEVSDIDRGSGPTTQPPTAGGAGDASSAGGFDFEN
jgi:uncharacterized membrane protein YjgN (DUF898 family)